MAPAKNRVERRASRRRCWAPPVGSSPRGASSGLLGGGAHEMSIGSAPVATIRPAGCGRFHAMPNIRQQKKRVRRPVAGVEPAVPVDRQDADERLQAAVEDGDAATVATEHRELVRWIDKAASHGALHANSGGRKNRRPRGSSPVARPRSWRSACGRCATTSCRRTSSTAAPRNARDLESQAGRDRGGRGRQRRRPTGRDLFPDGVPLRRATSSSSFGGARVGRAGRRPLAGRSARTTSGERTGVRLQHRGLARSSAGRGLGRRGDGAVRGGRARSQRPLRSATLTVLRRERGRARRSTARSGTLERAVFMSRDL